MTRILFWTALGVGVGLLVGCDMQTAGRIASEGVQGAAQGFATGGPMGALIGGIGGLLVGGGTTWSARDSKRDKILGQIVQAVGAYLDSGDEASTKELRDLLSREMDSGAKQLVKKLKNRLGIE